jgi:hypothetical protein
MTATEPDHLPHEPEIEPDLPLPVVDEAVDLATTRVRVAEQEFVETPVGTDEAVLQADRVTHRAEDLDDLAEEAAARARRLKELRRRPL